MIQAGPEGTFPSTDVVLPEDDDAGATDEEATSEDPAGEEATTETTVAGGETSDPEEGEGEEPEEPVSYEGLAVMPGNAERSSGGLYPDSALCRERTRRSGS